jgi:hypothetical protein
LRISKSLIEGYNHSYHPVDGLRFEAGRPSAVGVVIPDVRWPAANEGTIIKENGGQLWLVERPGTSQKGSAVAKHDSETQPIPTEVFDVIIRNDRGLEELAHGVDEAMMARKVGVHP